MAKLSGMAGTATGKIGSQVYAVNAGEQIVREYQPNVKNPSTMAQVNQRSKLALLSQLAAAMAPTIAIPRDGMKTPRNLFIKKNSENVSAVSGEAQVSYENLQITNGNTALPAVSVTRVADTSVTCELAGAAAADISRVVYNVFIKTEEEKLSLVQSAVCSEPGEGRTFQKVLPYIAGELVVFAYGMKDQSANATAKYGSYHVESGVDVAGLFATRKLTTSDIQLTATRGNTLFANENATIEAGDGQVMVYITAEGPGSVEGTGFSGNRKAVNIGTSVTVTATPASGATFLGWKNNGGSQYLSQSASYTFTANALTDLVAVFRDPNANGGDDLGDMG